VNNLELLRILCLFSVSIIIGSNIGGLLRAQMGWCPKTSRNIIGKLIIKVGMFGYYLGVRYRK